MLYVSRLDSDGMVRYVGGFGVSNKDIHNWAEIPITLSWPTSDCIRQDELIWLIGQDELLLNYPDLAEFPQDEKLATLISLPIEVTFAPSAALGILVSEEIKPDPELISFIWAIAGLLGMYASHISGFNIERNESISKEHFTRRQLTVLKLLREKLTNKQIADELGFSESTVRQETIRIYQILKVANRREASQFKFNDEI